MQGLEIVRCFCELDERADAIVAHRAGAAEDATRLEVFINLYSIGATGLIMNQDRINFFRVLPR